MPSRRHAVVGALAVLLCAAQACTLFTNLTGFSDDGPDGGEPGSPEAGTGVEASAGDGGGGGDGAAGGPYCKSLTELPLFCADFDDGLTPDQIFIQRVVEHGDAGVQRVDGKHFVSPPASLELGSVDVVSQASAINAVYTLGARPATKSLRLELDVRAEGVPSDANLTLGGMGFETSDGVGVALVQRGGQLIVDEGTFSGLDGGPGSHPLGRGLPDGQWAHVSIRLDLVARRISASVDGEAAVDAPWGLLDGGAGGPAILIFGYISDGPRTWPVMSIRYDNVALFGE